MLGQRTVYLQICLIPALLNYVSTQITSNALGSQYGVYSSYGKVFQPMDPSIVPKVNAANATILTLCEIWEDDGIPITPGIEVALRRIRPHFAFLDIEFRILTAKIPGGCGDATVVEAAPALVNLHLNMSVTGCSLVVGPGCTNALENVRGLAMFWDLPVVTSGASGLTFEEKNRTKVLTRFGYTQEDVSMFVVHVLDHYNWTDIVLLYDTNEYSNDFRNGFETVIRLNRIELYQRTTFIPMVSSIVQDDSSSTSTYVKGLLSNASDRARVFIISGLPRTVHKVLMAAESLGMTNGDYVYLTTNLIETKSHGFSDLSYFDDELRKDPTVKILYDSLLVVRMKTPADDPGGKAEFDDFANTIKNVSEKKFGYTYSSGEQVTHLVLGIWDAIMFYAIAVYMTFVAHENIFSGRMIASKIWGHSFAGVVIECTISQYGDRNFPYYLLDVNMAANVYQPALLLDSRQILQSIAPIHWPYRENAPLNKPACGFRGELRVVSGIPVTAITISVIVVAGLISGVAAYLVYRFNTRNAAANSWKVDPGDIISRDVPMGSSQGSKGSKGSRAGNRIESQAGSQGGSRATGGSSTEFRPCSSAYYFQAIVAVKEVNVAEVKHLGTSTVAELKTLIQMTNSSHIARFRGLCVDPIRPCILVEYFPRGSMTDLLENESLNLDWTFKYSLIDDIVEGLTAVRNSTFKSHGRISSNNCLVDSRFVVKITDLGLSNLRPSSVASSNNIFDPDMTPPVKRSLLWRAPELLRIAHPQNGTPKGDIYSFGILLHQIAQRCGPYEGEGNLVGQYDLEEILLQIRDFRMVPPFRPKIPFNACVGEIHFLMSKCWDENPAERPTLEFIQRQLRSIPGNKKGSSLMDSLLSRMEKYAADLEETVGERTAAFIDEKKRSEDLLYQMLPKAVANSLKLGQTVQPETYDSVTVYFSDIVGFDVLQATSTPVEIVDFLNDLYTLLDGIIEAYDVYKIETIGDSYLVVSGLPQRNESRHAYEIARMSTHVIASSKVFRIRHQPKERLSLRVGLHSGPCAAGVVGLKMPRYCIFGDTVNVASRVEGTGEPTKIHVSIDTKNLLGEHKEFTLECRGEVPLKGRGKMVTYWLKSSAYNN